MGEPARLIELGLLLVGELSELQQEALRAAREQLGKALEEAFPAFRWRLPLVAAPAYAANGTSGLDEPAARLVEGVQERDARAWDFALVVTGHDLRSHYQSYAFGVPSRALGVAVLSLARLSDGERDGEVARLAARIRALALHLFGDLNGIWHRQEPGAAMQVPDGLADLDGERSFDAEERRALEAALDDVADLRLEETEAPPRPLRFYLRASWQQAGEIGSAVVQARPWELPLRLSRLTAAALSALFLLIVTAEVWDLGASQRPATLAGLSLGVLAGTTAFVLVRQQLILRRGRRRLREQTVVMNVSAALVVLLGLLTTQAALFATTALLGATLFGAELIARWAPGPGADGGLAPLLSTASLVSSLGLLIGALGASFEEHHYFRHVIYADEET